jgi:SAM-dependent methyltransferase
VAVVVTTYNHAGYLGAALDSVVAQSHPVDEIVVVDDGSSDDPAAVVAHYGGVRLIRQPNAGLASARNRGLEAVGTDRVVFLDADDVLCPDAVALGLACFAHRPGCGLVYGAHRRVDATGRQLGATSYTPIKADAYRQFLRANVIGMHATVMYDREVLSGVGGFNPALRQCEDYDAFLRLAQITPIASHPGTVAHYRWHGSNMSADPRLMLTAALGVLDLHASRAQASDETARDWRAGRAAWRSYYTGQILNDAVVAWRRDQQAVPLARALVRAVRTGPLPAAGWVTGRAVHRLPAPVSYRIKRLLGRPASPPVGSVDLGHLERDVPISTDFGFDRGTPIDRHYIELFLADNADVIAGRVLEVGDDSYCRRFGADRITHQDVLHVATDNPAATIVGDLAAGVLPAATFDCLVLTQTLHLIFDLRAAVAEIHRALRPGGTALVTVPGISQIDRGEWGDTWYWSLTPAAARRLFAEAFGPAQVSVEAQGNVFAATAFLQGLAVEEVSLDRLERHDPAYPVIVTVRATRIEGDEMPVPPPTAADGADRTERPDDGR